MEERDNIKNSVKIRKCDTFFLSKMNGSFSVPQLSGNYLVTCLESPRYPTPCMVARSA